MFVFFVFLFCFFVARDDVIPNNLCGLVEWPQGSLFEAKMERRSDIVMEDDYKLMLFISNSRASFA